MSRRLLVLGWHNVEPTWWFHGRSPEAGRRAFERQVRFLRRSTTVVPLRSALEDLAAGRSLPPRAVALTFDDGYLDNVTVAAPMLAALGMPATFFLVPGFLSGEVGAWWESVGWAFAGATARELRWDDRRFDLSAPSARRAAARIVGDALKMLDDRRRRDAVAELQERLRPAGPAPGRAFMDWQEAKDLLRHGHDIGSHTCRHPILSHEVSATQDTELRDSRRELAGYFDRPIDVLAFPNGQRRDYSEETLRLTRASGYAWAVTTRPGFADATTSPYEVSRVVIKAEVSLGDVLGKAKRVAATAVTAGASAVRRRAASP